MSLLWTWASMFQHFTKAISGCLFGYSVFDLQRRWGQLSGWSLRSSVIKLEVLLDLGQSSWGFPHTFSSAQSLSSVQLFAHGLQHTRPPCPSPTPGACSNSCPLSRWCHPTIPSSVAPSSSHLQSFPATGSFQMSQLYAWGGQSPGASPSASVLPMNTQDWSSLGWTGWISLQSKGLSRVFSNTTVQNHQFFGTKLSL